jgi:molybdopterin synthase sulfur carrier subunit
MATIVIPALLRKYTGGKDRIVASGRNVGQLIDDLERQYPGLREHVIEDGDVKPSIAISVDGDMSTGGILEPVRDSSEVFILPAIGGG